MESDNPFAKKLNIPNDGEREEGFYPANFSEDNENNHRYEGGISSKVNNANKIRNDDPENRFGNCCII